MSEQHLAQLHDAISAIPRDKVLSPNMPVAVAVQEAEDLAVWSQHDRAALERVGLPWSLVEELPRRAGAARQAQSRWMAQRFAQEEARRRWKERAPGVFDLRDRLVHTFFYAFRRDPELIGRVRAIDAGEGAADVVQDLSDLVALGRNHLDLLQAVGFEPQNLEQAADLSEQAARLYAEGQADARTSDEAQLLRNRAYTYLKQAVDEVRAAGRYVFWRTPHRARGYASDYHRRPSSADTSDDDATTPSTSSPTDG